MSGSSRPWLPWFAAIGVGALSAIQSRSNGSLGGALESGLHAAAISFSTGFLLITVVGLCVRRLRLGLVRLLAALRSGQMPWWWASGGVFGALFIFSQSFSVGIIGVALFAVSLVSGQNLASLVIDAVGLGPRGQQNPTAVRVGSSLIGIVAVLVAVSGRVGDNSLSMPAVLLCTATGVAVAFQQAINGRSTTVSREPMVAAWTNFAVGALVLSTLFGAVFILGVHSPQPLPDGPWWLYVGGAIGVIFLGTTAWVVGKVGVLAVSLLITAGQLVGALVLDAVLLDVVDVYLVAGVLLSFAAVALTAFGGVLKRDTSPAYAR